MHTNRNLPSVIVLDMSSLDRWKLLLNVNDNMFRQIIECLLLTYPDSGYTDGLWYIMDKHIDMDFMDVRALEELSIRFDELSFDMDMVIQGYLGPHIRDYSYMTMLEPYGAAFKLFPLNK